MNLRPWRIALLCLLMALLPLRGWAWAGMQVRGAMPQGAIVATSALAGAHHMAPQAQAPQAQAQVHPTAAVPPCHGRLAQASASAHTTPQDTAPPQPDHGSQAGTCSLCDLCHAGALPHGTTPHAVGPLPLREALGWSLTTPTGRAWIDPLFKPPRG